MNYCRRITQQLRYRPSLEPLEERRLPASVVWTGLGFNDNWSTGANWQGGFAPSAGDDLVFPNGAQRLNNFNSFAPGTLFRSIAFSGPELAGYTLRGNAIVLTHGLVENETGSSAVFSFEDRIELDRITLAASQTFLCLTPNYGTLSVYTPVDLNGFTLTLDTGRQGFSRAYLGDVVSGTGQIEKIGTGWWFMFGENTYHGLTLIHEGAITIGANNALGSAQEGTVVDRGAQLIVQFVPVRTAEPITLNGGSGGLGDINVYADDTAFTGTITLNADSLIHATLLFDPFLQTQLTGSVITNGFTLTLSGALDTTLLGTISGGGSVFVKTNRILNGTGSVAGSVVVEQGTLAPGVDAPGILTTGGAFLNPGTTFSVLLNGADPGSGYSQLEVDGSISLNGSTLNAVLNFNPAGGSQFVIMEGSGPLSGTFNGLPNGATLTIGGRQFQITYVSGGGPGNLEVSSQVILTLGGGGGPPPTPQPIPGPPFRPIPAGVNIFVTGADAGGGPDVQIFNAATGTVLFGFFPYATNFTGGVRVATADLNADSFPDVICAAGPGGGPNVVAYSGKNARQLFNFFAYDPGFTGGVYLAAGDIDGDGRADIICGADAGGGPNVTVFSGATGAPFLSLYAYDPGFTGGVRVAAGDIDGSGRASIICGAGPGGGPNVTVFRGDGVIVASFFAYAPQFTAGIYVGAGDVTGDGQAEVVTGAGASGGPNVGVFEVNGFGATQLLNMFPYDPQFFGGVRVAACDRNGDGLADVICVPGPGGGPDVRILNGVTGQQIDQFFAYNPAFTGGLYVAAGQ